MLAPGYPYVGRGSRRDDRAWGRALGDNRPVFDANSAVGARLRRVQILNYKSISKATVDLGRLTILVGPNGAGKSNFLDALSFVRDCLSDSVEFAFKNRGGITAVRRRSGGHPTHIGLRLIVDLPNDQAADYSFQVAAEQG
jgi:predicted ATP-binding protein involved in virulence